MFPKEECSFVRVAKLNNKATRIIHQGEYAHAIALLSHAALNINKNDMNEHQQDVGSSSVAPSFEFVSSKRRQRCLSETSCTRNTTDCVHSSLTSSSSWFLYDDAIQVNAKQAILSEHITEILSYAIIYNLALSHHLEGCRLLGSATNTKNNDSNIDDEAAAKLQRAVVLYNHAQQLLCLNADICNDKTIHTLAITNNLGHVYHCLRQEPTAKMCLERLLNAIMYLSSDATICEESRLLMAKHDVSFQGFLTNVMTVLNGSSLPAAAA